MPAPNSPTWKTSNEVLQLQAVMIPSLFYQVEFVVAFSGSNSDLGDLSATGTPVLE
jgi:hypothetical protein